MYYFHNIYIYTYICIYAWVDLEKDFTGVIILYFRSEKPKL